MTGVGNERRGWRSGGTRRSISLQSAGRYASVSVRLLQSHDCAPASVSLIRQS